MIPVLLVLTLMLGPFHAPDDDDHVKRAYTLAHGAVWPVNRPGSATGGMIDAGLDAMVRRHHPLVTDWGRSGLPDYREHGPAPRGTIAWTGSVVFSPMPGAASYLPLIYLPQAVALRVGEALRLPVQGSVALARVANGVAAVALIAAALTRMPYAAGLTVALLLLPKSLVQFASNSADPLIHALTLWVLVFGLRGLCAGVRPGVLGYVGVAVALLVLVGVRPPAVVVAVLPLAVAVRQRDGVGAALVVAGVGAALAWFHATSGMILDPRCGAAGSLVEKAAAFATGGPGLVLRTVLALGPVYLLTFIGEAGWSTAALDGWVYAVALLVMALACVSDGRAGFVRAPLVRGLLLVAAAGSAVLVLFAMYVVCTAQSEAVIRGVQGRYFMTAALVLAPVMAGLWPRRAGWLRLGLPAILVVFAGLMTVMLAVEGQRLYGWPQI